MTEAAVRTTAVEWLLREIADDERVARAATAGPWRLTDRNRKTEIESETATVPWEFRKGEPLLVVVDCDGCGAVEPADAEHIARHDPARVLAECEAKRLLVEAFRNDADRHPDYVMAGQMYVKWAAARRVLRLVALSFASRPGYAEHWPSP